MNRRHLVGVKRALQFTFGLILFVAVPALASVSQGFPTSGSIPIGSLVALDTGTKGDVVVANLNNSDRLFGVAVAPSSAELSLGGDTNGQTQVATTGSATILVSTAGGPINVGDYISVSSISGVGQKAVSKTRVIGTAEADFTGNESGDTHQKISTGSGHTTVAIGQIPIVIAVTTYAAQTSGAYTVPPWLEHFTTTLIGKTVTPVRIILAALILIVALISVSVLLYAGVRNSIISIGRNPLSRSAVYKGLFQVIIVAVIILAVAGGAMYLIMAR